MLDCIIVGAGGFIGSVCRYLIGMIPVKETWGFPVKTFAINLAGAFVIGIIAAVALKNQSLNPRVVLFLKVGLCGGFTTFSSFALETGDLIGRGNTAMALLYAVSSMVLGVAAVFAGQAVVS
ncbi:MAG TPA: fluoride efflux transporter CrcB [Candidatus Mediterraneibacter cottocaccae]|nr:fluoride efflux transporter CrcB [Candidatus Mediterraneibacter cottocaccae]